MYTTRSTLLQKLQNNDDVGYPEFYAAYRNLIQSIALKNNIPPADTDDIIQSVMLGIFNNGTFLYSKEKHGLFRTYLGGTIRHKISDYFRARSPIPESLLTETPENHMFEEIFKTEYRAHLLELATDELRRLIQYRLVLQLYDTLDQQKDRLNISRKEL